MKSLKLKRLCAVIMTATLGMSLFAGCGDKTADNGQNLIFNIGSEPDTIDPTLNTSTTGGTIIVNAFEGLTRLDENDVAVPGVAKDWSVSDDGLVYTFNLRDDAKWSDGEPVTANDFKYSWVRGLTQETAAEYAYQLFYIKNGEAYYNGEAKAEDLGINVIDEHTLEVTLEGPTTYFPELMAFPTYMPLRENVVSADPDTWATNPETYVSNGPFKLVKFEMKSQYVFERNENYWDAGNVKLDNLTFKLVEDIDTAYASLKNGEFDMVEEAPPAEIEGGKAEGLVHTNPYLGIYFFAVNVGKQDGLSDDVKAVLSNKLVRKALNLAINRQEIIDKVGKADQVAAYSFVPPGITLEDGSDFASKKYYDETAVNVEEAKKLLEEAGYPNGEGLPTLELMYNSGSSHGEVCQIIQQNWAAIGVKVELTNQEWAVFLNTRQNGEYQISRHGWIGDYLDPMTFLDMWVTGGGNNDAGFSNAEYDKLVAEAKKESDATKRAELLRSAEDILMEEMPVLPVYYYNKTRAWKPEVKGILSSTLGQIDFKGAYKE